MKIKHFLKTGQAALNLNVEETKLYTYISIKCNILGTTEHFEFSHISQTNKVFNRRFFFIALILYMT